jgi:predicted aspartyl protease
VDYENKIGNSSLMFANLCVMNNSFREQPRKCRVEALCDTGCSFELVLPGAKAHQLQLEARRQTTAHGFGSMDSTMTIFSPVCVTIVLLDPATNTEISKVWENISLFLHETTQF